MQNQKEIIYLNKTLSKGEKILETANLHWMAYLPVVFYTIIGLITIFVGVGLFFLIVAGFKFLSNRKTEMIVTNKRIVIKKGIIAVKTDEVKNGKIESISIRQGILGRVFDYSDLYFSGTGTEKVKFTYVAQPVITKSKIEDVIEKSNK